MKGQTKIIIFLLLFLIGVILIYSANLWGSGIVQQNVDLVKIETAENFMRNLDNKILSLIEYGGSRLTDYNFDFPIQLVGDNTFELSFESSISLPNYWINITTGKGSFIRERQDENVFRIQTVYPESDYRVEMFANGTTLAIPEYIVLVKNDTYMQGSKTVIKIEITFMK